MTQYFIPHDINGALDILANKRPKILAGGTDVFAATQEEALPEPVLDLSGIDELGRIRTTDDGGVTIGAGVTWSDVIRAPLPSAFDGLKSAARRVGGVQIQNRATLVGNLCNASPAADGVPPLLTLEASLTLASANGQRTVSLEDFISGPRQTALNDDELVIGLNVPPQYGSTSSFEKLGSRAYLVISIAMVAVNVRIGTNGTIDWVRIAVGACSPVATRIRPLENALKGQRPGEVDIDSSYFSALAPIDDARGTGAYREEVVAELSKRALMAATHD